jgi:hypothetical protein
MEGHPVQRELPWNDPTRAAVAQAASNLLYDLGPRGAERVTGVSRGTLRAAVAFRRAPSVSTTLAVLLAAVANEMRKDERRQADA